MNQPVHHAFPAASHRRHANNCLRFAVIQPFAAKGLHKTVEVRCWWSAKAAMPDIILLDIGLLGMDGYEVTTHLREQPGLRDVPLVAVSGYAREEDLFPKPARRYGVRFLDLDKESLEVVSVDAEVSRWLRLARLRGRVNRQTIEPEPFAMSALAVHSDAWTDGQRSFRSRG